MLACYPNYRQGVEVVAVYCAQGFTGFTKSRIGRNRTAISSQRWQKQSAFSPEEYVIEKHLPPRGYCAFLVAGGSCHQESVIVPWRQGLLHHVFFRRKSRLLFPPLTRYRCSVVSSSAFRKSCNALRTVDYDNFNSLAIVGIAGQHSPFLFDRSAR